MAVLQTRIVWFFLLSPLLLLILVDPSKATPVTASNGQPREDGTLKLCNKIIPGLDRMARGIDATKFVLFTDDVLHSGYGKVVLNFSCNSDQKWTHPNDPKTQYNWPDQVSGADPLPVSKMSIKTAFSQNMTDYKRKLGVKVGLEITGDDGKDDEGNAKNEGYFSAGVNYENVQENFLVSNKSVGEVSVSVDSMMLDLNAPESLLLSNDFQGYIVEKLPAQTCADNPQLYAQFIRDYGTHYFDSALFGGYLQQQSTIDQDYVANNTEHKIKSNLAFSFMKVFNIEFSNEFDRKDEDVSFHLHSERVFSYFGGLGDWMQEDYKKAGQLSTWTQTVNQNPWLLSGKLKPLDNLVVNASLKTQVQIAIQLYLLDARITEVKRTVQLMNFPLTIRETAILEHATKQVKSCDNADIVNVHKNLNQVSSVVKPLTKEFADELKRQVKHFHEYTYLCIAIYTFKCPIKFTTEANDQLGRWKILQDLNITIHQPESLRKAIQIGRQFLETESSFVADVCPVEMPLNISQKQCMECVVKESRLFDHPSDKIRDMYERYDAELKRNVTTVNSV